MAPPLTSIVSAVAPAKVLFAMVSDADPLKAPVAVRSIALPPPPVEAMVRPRISDRYRLGDR